MQKTKKTETDHIEQARAALVAAALPHVDFDGWSATTLRAAIADSGVDAGLAVQAVPRGALDLAAAFHRAGDDEMVAALDADDLQGMRFRDKIAHAVRLRIEIAAQQKEAVRRGVTLFSLPQNGIEGGQLLWGTAGAIWDALGDDSEDVNWYTKRATLSGVYSATVLYWLGDDSVDNADTWAFLDRRIDNVMQFEKLKAGIAKTPLGGALEQIFGKVEKPRKSPREDLPGYQRIR